MGILSKLNPFKSDPVAAAVAPPSVASAALTKLGGTLPSSMMPPEQRAAFEAHLAANPSVLGRGTGSGSKFGGLNPFKPVGTLQSLTGSSLGKLGQVGNAVERTTSGALSGDLGEVKAGLKDLHKEGADTAKRGLDLTKKATELGMDAATVVGRNSGNPWLERRSEQLRNAGYDISDDVIENAKLVADTRNLNTGFAEKRNRAAVTMRNPNLHGAIQSVGSALAGTGIPVVSWIGALAAAAAIARQREAGMIDSKGALRGAAGVGASYVGGQYGGGKTSLGQKAAIGAGTGAVRAGLAGGNIGKGALLGAAGGVAGDYGARFGGELGGAAGASAGRSFATALPSGYAGGLRGEDLLENALLAGAAGGAGYYGGRAFENPYLSRIASGAASGAVRGYQRGDVGAGLQQGALSGALSGIGSSTRTGALPGQLYSAYQRRQAQQARAAQAARYRRA